MHAQLTFAKGDGKKERGIYTQEGKEQGEGTLFKCDLKAINERGSSKINTFHIVTEMKLGGIYVVKYNGSMIILCFVQRMSSNIKSVCRFITGLL